MNIELSVKEENGVVKIKITSPDKPVVIETATDTNTAGTPVTVAAEQNESVSPATETATTDETLKAEAAVFSAKLAAIAICGLRRTVLRSKTDAMRSERTDLI